jgi:DNA modification methylase
MSDWQVITGDCLKVMPTLDRGDIAAVVTDPPYGVDFRKEGWDSFIPDWLGIARNVAPLVGFTTAPTTLWDYPRPDWVSCWYREAAQSRTVYGSFNHWTPVVIYGRPYFKVDSIKLHAIVNSSPKDLGHPSPKPIAFMRWMVENFSRPGDLILDPFCGSGTTGVACVQTGRRFIGIEIDEGYATIARDRISKAAEQARQLELI